MFTLFVFLCVIKTTLTSPVASKNSLDFTQNSRNEVENDRSFLAYRRMAVVKLPDLGTLQGSVDQTAWTKRIFFTFTGIKFAESPRDNLRFKPPVPVKQWSGIKSAEKYGQSCPTIESIANTTKEERTQHDYEDCLFLDIFTPQIDDNAKIPVMVYVHGGDFINGKSKEHPPHYLLEKNIVFVTVNYRLSALGFLSTKTKDIPGNAGLLDVIAALEFIQRNIVYFGGDPSQVTVFGQSAGAVMVSALSVSPSVPHNLFRRMIVQSGSIFSSWSVGKDPVEAAKDLAQRAGVSSRLSLSQLNKAFINMDLLELLNKSSEQAIERTFYGINTISGRSLTLGGPSNLFPNEAMEPSQLSSTRSDLEVIAGTTKNDGSYITTMIYQILSAAGVLDNKAFVRNDLLRIIERVFSIDDESGGFEALATNTYWTREQLLRADFNELSTGFTDLSSLIAFKGPIIRMIHSNALRNPNHTFLYTFDYSGEYTRFGYEENVNYSFNGGVTHSNDILYLFPFPPEKSKLNEADRNMAIKMVDLWTSFARTGKPSLSNDSTFDWPPVKDSYGPYLHINENMTIGDYFVDEYTVAVREGKVSRT